jgi:hypothetical protein
MVAFNFQPSTPLKKPPYTEITRPRRQAVAAVLFIMLLCGWVVITSATLALYS